MAVSLNEGSFSWVSTLSDSHCLGSTFWAADVWKLPDWSVEQDTANLRSGLAFRGLLDRHALQPAPTKRAVLGAFGILKLQ